MKKVVLATGDIMHTTNTTNTTNAITAVADVITIMNMTVVDAVATMNTRKG